MFTLRRFFAEEWRYGEHCLSEIVSDKAQSFVKPMTKSKSARYCWTVARATVKVNGKLPFWPVIARKPIYIFR